MIQADTLELATDDPGLLYGATVFTTLRVYNQSLDSQLTNWVAHCDRLAVSLQAFSWQQPDWKRLRYGAELLMTHFPVLRVAVFPDGREWIIGRFLPPDLAERQQLGVTAWLAEASHFQRSIPEHKTGNYLPAWLALKTAQSLGATEAILLDSAGNWLETSTGNLWGWRDGRWWTPPLVSGILPGLMRSQLIYWCESKHEPVGEVPWDANWVRELEAIAYTNSVVEVVPIRRIWREETNLIYNPSHLAFQGLRSYFHKLN